MQNLKKTWLVVWKWQEEYSTFSPEHLKNLKIGIFVILSSKVKNAWSWNLQRSYKSWQWRMMQNLKRNWLVVSKLKWGISRVLTRALKSLKIGTLMGSFWTKHITFELKKYRAFMFDSSEDWCKIWRKIDLRLPKWHEEFGNFSPKHLKNLKIETLMGSFYSK